MEHIQGYQDCSHQFHQESKVSATHAVVIHLQGPPSKSAFKFSFQNPNLPEIPLPFIDCWWIPTKVEIIDFIMRIKKEIKSESNSVHITLRTIIFLRIVLYSI